MKLAVVLALTAFVATVPSVAQADPPTRVTIVAVFNPLTYGETGYVNGQLLGDNQAGQTVALEQAPPPTFDQWTPVLQTTADAAGYYSFKLKTPSQTMAYRTNSQGTPSDGPVQVAVAPRIKLKAATAGKTSIRFSGTFAPALDGQSVAIQKRSSGGSGWTTVANARLKGGRAFEGRIRAHKSTKLRAFFLSDGAHLDGVSNSVTVTPGARASTAARSAATPGRSAAARCAAPRITRIATTPDPPVAGQGMTLRVTTTMPTGRVYAVDVLWGEGDKRDHFTLAPSYRKRTVTFTLRHRYAAAGTYTLRIRTFGNANGCKRSATTRSRLRAVS